MARYDVTAAPYNADNTGVNDVRAAVQSAINAADSAGGGEVYFPKGTYLFKTTVGAYKLFLRPRPNITFNGEGIGSILKADAGLNTTASDDGFSFIRHIISDESRTTCDNVEVKNLHFYHNGLNNLVPSAYPNKQNIAVGIEAGTNIKIHNNTFTLNAGARTVVLGDGVSSSPTIHHAIVRDNVFSECGGEVTGNQYLTDHSSVYVQGDDVVITGNIFTNTGAGYLKCTGIEIHSQNIVVSNNVFRTFKHMMNIAATVMDADNVVINGNVGVGVCRAFQFWTATGKVLKNVRVSNNNLKQIAGSDVGTEAFIDTDSGVVSTSPIESLTVVDNTCESLQATGNSNAASGFAIGRVKRLIIGRNKFKGFKGRGIDLVNLDTTMRLTIENNEIEDCGTTSDSNYRQGIVLNSASTIPYAKLTDNRIWNVASSYMTTAIYSNATITDGSIKDTTTNITTPFNLSCGAGLRLMHTGAGSPASVVSAGIGSEWLRSDGGTSTTLYIKESGSGNTGWVAK